jgi:small subunit ribosomal protein S9
MADSENTEPAADAAEATPAEAPAAKAKAPAKKPAAKKAPAKKAAAKPAKEAAPAEGEALAAEAEAPEAVEETPVAETPAAEAAPEVDASDSDAGDSDSSEAAGGEASSEPDAPSLESLQAIVAKPPKNARYQSTGKRKTSVARVIVTPGKGDFWINGRTLQDYFPRESLRTAILEPMVLSGAVGTYHVRARIHGGGVSSQAGALRHGIAKALGEIDPHLRTQLKSRGLLKLDARQVERKKAGLKKARKKPQFSKR